MHTNGAPPVIIPLNGKHIRDSSKFCGMFWVTDSERMVDDHPTQMILLKSETWKERKDSTESSNVRTWRYHGMNDYALRTRSSVLHRFWRDHISDKHCRRGNIPSYAQAPLSVPKATFSFAMTVMDKMEGWNEEEWVGTKLAAFMWIYTKAVLCDGRRRDPPQDLRQMPTFIMESVSWVTEDFLWGHEWVTEPNVHWKENDILEALNYDIEVPCPLQWALLWFSAPSSLNRNFVNNGTKVAKFRDTVSSAIELTCNIAFDGAHIPRACFSRAVTVFLCYAPDKDWDMEEEMQGWCVGEHILAALSSQGVPKVTVPFLIVTETDALSAA